ncbi:hypothetical protein FYJ43_07605 [Cutibacterium sp. WCA-380-WT-3A]|uniref:Uncharacterized protein n=1 Tax=Cutibacterium porci TaxID=2605781 RepID=A0A7K0J7U7_9ACTN|nr:hypothetical protein [Cutibacterium porci]MSS45903.1 hypothetical protein [Cutibacterium porci]
MRIVWTRLAALIALTVSAVLDIVAGVAVTHGRYDMAAMTVIVGVLPALVIVTALIMWDEWGSI